MFFGCNRGCECERDRREDCFRPTEHVSHERFVKETRCVTNWHREPDCGCERDRKDCWR